MNLEHFCSNFFMLLNVSNHHFRILNNVSSIADLQFILQITKFLRHFHTRCLVWCLCIRRISWSCQSNFWKAILTERPLCFRQLSGAKDELHSSILHRILCLLCVRYIEWHLVFPFVGPSGYFFFKTCKKYYAHHLLIFLLILCIILRFWRSQN
jgi:hypothetical protein